MPFPPRRKKGSPLQWEGEVSLIPLRSEGRLSLESASGQPVCGSLLRTIPIWNNRRVRLPSPPDITWMAASSPIQMTFDRLKFSLSDLSLQLLQSDKAFLQLKKVTWMRLISIWRPSNCMSARLLVEEGAVDVRINETGGLNLQRIVRASKPAEQRRQKPSPPGAPPSKSVAGADQKTPSPHTSGCCSSSPYRDGSSSPDER